MFDEKILKIGLLLGGLIIGFFLLKQKKELQEKIGGLVFNVLLPYIIFIEISSMEISEFWWGYSLAGAAFVLIPFFALPALFRLTEKQSALFATAEGGTIGFAVYATIATEPLARFFLVDMIGNGLSVFLVLLPFMMRGKRSWNKTFTILVSAMILGLIMNHFGVHPLEQSALLSGIEMVLVSALLFLIAVILGSGVELRVSKEIVQSWIFAGFWSYRLALLVVSFIFHFPLAITILAILPPSFMLPVFYKTQDMEIESVYASSFIASCLPISVGIATILIIFY